MISIKNLTKIYRSKKSTDCIALDNINISLPDTGMVFIIGKSGSGKSTLLNLIGGLDTITTGSINIDGNEVGKMKSKDFDNYRSSYLTFVFQDYKLFENLTVYQNIEVGLDVNDSLNHDKIKNSLKKVGLSDYEKRYPYELSGGQQQRVAIARALSRDSRLILADEPTGNLDFNTSRQILAILKEVSKEKLVIIVSHNLMDADIYADRIIELHDGKVLSDKEKRKNYYNSFKIEGDKITLPHYYNLNNVQKNKMLEAIKCDEIKEVIQNDNGFVDYEFKEESLKNVKLSGKKTKSRSLIKIFKMFLKKRVHNRLIMIIFSILLFTVLSVIQSFIMYEPNQTKVDDSEDIVVMYKGTTLPLETSLRTGSLYSIENDEFEAFSKLNSNNNIYKLNNYYLTYASTSQTSKQLTSALYSYNEFYTEASTGTLVCDENFLANMFLDKNEIEVICGDLNDKPYGIIITDYTADSLIYHNKAKSYDEILGNNNFKSCYVNAIIKTDYKEKYSELSKVYEEIVDEITFYNTFNQNELLQQFINECEKKYNILYSLNPNFKNDLIDSSLKYSTYVNQGTLLKDDYIYDIHDYSIFLLYTDSYNSTINVKSGEIILSVQLYNKLFGTVYTVNDYDLSINNSFNLVLYTYVDGNKVITYNKEFKIKSLSNASYVDDEDFKEILQHQIIDFGLYFENNESSNDLISYGNDHSFYLKTVDFESGLVINKMTSTFNNLFIIILICIYIVFGFYIIIYGVNTVKSNKEEIGIYKALGGKFRNIAKVLFIDVLLTGVIISVLSLFFTPFIIHICDNIIVNSFKNVLNLAAVNIEIIKIYPGILALNYSLLNILILISSVVPTILLIKLKPIEIIKN